MRAAVARVDWTKLLYAGLAAAAIALVPRTAPALTIHELPDYDADFRAACGDSCDIAVAEALAGDGRADTANPRELGIGPDTATSPPAGGYAGFAWDGNPHAFTLSYDAVGTVLTFTVGGTAVVFDIDLSGALSMFIRAKGLTTDFVELTNLTLNGETVPDLIGDDDPDYLRLFDFEFTDNWLLSGDINMPSGGKNARPSTQFKLTSLAPATGTGIPEPATLALLAAGLAGAGVLRRSARRR